MPIWVCTCNYKNSFMTLSCLIGLLCWIFPNSIWDIFSVCTEFWLRNLDSSSHLKEQGFELNIIVKWKIGVGHNNNSIIPYQIFLLNNYNTLLYTCKHTTFMRSLQQVKRPDHVAVLVSLRRGDTVPSCNSRSAMKCEYNVM